MNGKTTTFEWPVSHFDLEQIAESGQVFRWERRGPYNYLIPAGDQVCVAYMTAPDRLAVRCPENRAAFWRYYFGLGDPYPEYWRTINAWAERDGPDAYLSKAAAEASGMVVLHQPAWETMASFMISQNNNIPRIRASISAMCRRFGKKITTVEGEVYYTFPEPEALTDVADLAGLGLGYCHPYSPHERGSNENMNRILRRWFPKGTNFDDVTPAEVAEVARWMNNYPRRALGWKTASALFREYVAA